MSLSSPLKVAVIFGTRPEAIKLAPVIRKFKENPRRFEAKTIVTAQHREMLDQVLKLFSIQPDFDLNIIQPRQELAQITANAVTGLSETLGRMRPDIALVQKDTTTTFVGALAAFYQKITCGPTWRLG